MRSNKQGFTLIELSIVLLIIAALIGGIVMVKSLIRDAQLRGVVGELQNYTRAISDFRDKYSALPGDFSGAVALWGQASGGCPTGAGTGSQTCDGDGNGRISNQTSGTYYEEFRAWQHLSNARMIDAMVTGIAGSTNAHFRIPGTNIPKSQLDGAGWGLTSITIGDVTTNAPNQIPYIVGDIPPNHLLWLGGTTISDTNQQTNMLTVEEALSIDTKIDDEQPNTGKVIAQINAAANPMCVAYISGFNTPLATDNYNAALHAQKICTLVFKTGF